MAALQKQASLADSGIGGAASHTVIHLAIHFVRGHELRWDKGVLSY